MWATGSARAKRQEPHDQVTSREMRRPWWASLGVKLFVSYLVVVAIGIATLLVAASVAAPPFSTCAWRA